MNIGERIKMLRKRLELTQLEFCTRIGLKRNSISLVEANKRNISNQAIHSICREFNVNENWLKFGEGEMFLPKAEDSLVEYLNSKGTSKKIQAFILAYLSLPPDYKEAVDRYIESVYEEMQGINETEKPYINLTRPEGLSDKEWETIVKMRTEEAMKKTEK
ncbi:MAG: helix-turn-helix transcriptional regulator [Selenomonadaceae bacterium]|nr:helix-turn-helix transcriptional regulator [Selenomonadaceae bacterium]